MDWKGLFDDVTNVMTDVAAKAEEKMGNINLKEINLKDIDADSIKGLAEDVHQRLSFGYHEITREEHLRTLTPLLNEVKTAARKLDPDFPADIKVYIRYEEDDKKRGKNKKEPEDVVALRPDAIGLSESFFKLPPGSQKAVLGIGFGKMLYFLNAKVFRDEFVSDEFCFNLGYGNELCGYLDTLKGKQKSIDARIGRLQELGSGYQKERENAEGNRQAREPEEEVKNKYVFNIQKPGQGEDINTEKSPDVQQVDGNCNAGCVETGGEGMPEEKAGITVCSVCHATITGTAKFCYNCGNRLDQD